MSKREEGEHLNSKKETACANTAEGVIFLERNERRTGGGEGGWPGKWIPGPGGAVAGPEPRNDGVFMKDATGG